MAGYDNNLVVTNLGTLFFVLVGHLSFFMIHIILFVLSKCSKTVDKARQRLSSYLYFSGSIRLVMEGLLDLVLFSLINLKDADWSGDFLMVTVNKVVCHIYTCDGHFFPYRYDHRLSLQYKAMG